VIMKLRARTDVVINSRGSSPHSDGEWGRWFAWYPVFIATGRNSVHWVWLEFVERKWSTSSVRKRRRVGRERHPAQRRRYRQKPFATGLKEIRDDRAITSGNAVFVHSSIRVRNTVQQFCDMAWLFLEIDMGECLPVSVAHDEASKVIFNGPWCG